MNNENTKPKVSLSILDTENTFPESVASLLSTGDMPIPIQLFSSEETTVYECKCDDFEAELPSTGCCQGSFNSAGNIPIGNTGNSNLPNATITPGGDYTKGEPLTFTIDHPAAWHAYYEEKTRNVSVVRGNGQATVYQNRPGTNICYAGSGSHIELLLGDKVTPANTGKAYYAKLVFQNASSILFSFYNFLPESMRLPNGETILLSGPDAPVKVELNSSPQGLKSIWIADEGLYSAEYPAANRIILKYYKPDQVSLITGMYVGTGTPAKTWTITKNKNGEVESTITTEQRGNDEPHIVEQEEQNGNLTVKTGSGPNQIIYSRIINQIDENEREILISTRYASKQTLDSHTRTVERNELGKWIIISHTEGYLTSAQTTTNYTYINGLLNRKETLPTGEYTRYEYDSQRRRTVIAKPWVGGGEMVQRTTYSQLGNIESVSEKIILDNNTEAMLKNTVYRNEDSDGTRRIITYTSARGSEHTQTTIEEYYSINIDNLWAAGRIKMHQAVNRVQTHFVYDLSREYGSVYKITRESRYQGQPVPGKSVRQIGYYSMNEFLICQETYVHTGTTWSLIEKEQYEYNETGHLSKTIRNNGRISTTEWMCCGPLRETDEDGVTISYGYNTSRQLIETIRSATETTPETITSFTRDAMGRILTLRTDTGPLTTTKTFTYDGIGRLILEKDELNRVTSRSYNHLNGYSGTYETITLPTGATIVTHFDRDGSIIAQTGTGQQNLAYRYNLSEHGIEVSEYLYNEDNPDNCGEFLRSLTTNGLGQTITVREASAESKLIVTLDQIENGPAKHLGIQENHILTTSQYNEKGQLIQNQIAGMAPTIYEYDEMGSQNLETIKLSETPSPCNSRITASHKEYRSLADGIYQIVTTITYNERGNPITERSSVLVSRLSPIIEFKQIQVDKRGHETSIWSEYSSPTIREQYRAIPGSDSREQQTVIDGFVVMKKDLTGAATHLGRSYFQGGYRITETDPRGNTTITEKNALGWTLAKTNPNGSQTLTGYHISSGKPNFITNPYQGTIRYAYDNRGRLTSEFGTATYPVAYRYDHADRIISQTTYRVPNETITTNPASRGDGDATTWSYDNATGMLLGRTYADGSKCYFKYDSYNRKIALVQSRGVTTAYTYAPLTGELLSIIANDGTPPIHYTYNHLGQLKTITDETGTRYITYDEYGDLETETINGLVSSTLTLETDIYGRRTGHSLTLYGQTIQQTRLEYDTYNRPLAYQLENSPQPFAYRYDGENGLLAGMEYPNALVKNISYMPDRNVINKIDYTTPGINSLLISHEHTRDHLNRITSQIDVLGMDMMQSNKNYDYNDRGELLLASDSHGENLLYQYDNIGNRKTSSTGTHQTPYQANWLNQYTGIGNYTPAYDRDGNQTEIRTSTGNWKVTYNANNRPIRFINEQTKIECSYDYMGRRTLKTAYSGTAMQSRIAYIYNEYTLIAEINLLDQSASALKTYYWDPLEPTHTRPLAMTLSGSNGTSDRQYLYLTHDPMKNVTALCDHTGDIRAAYQYHPYGNISASAGDMPLVCSLRHSSEYHDNELGLVYYNFRHYNPADGRWLTRDPIFEQGGLNIYGYNSNRVPYSIDYLGLKGQSLSEKHEECKKKKEEYEKKIDSLIKNYSNRDLNCKTDQEDCIKISIIIETGDPCKDWPHSCVGHAGIGIGDEFYDMGPSRGDKEEGSPASQWWDNPQNPGWIPSKDYKNKTPDDLGLQEILNNIENLSPEITILVEACVCKKMADQIKQYWKRLYDEMEQGKHEWSISGLQCSSAVAQSLSPYPFPISEMDQYHNAPPYQYLSPVGLLELVLKSKNCCGDRKGEGPSTTKLKGFSWI